MVRAPHGQPAAASSPGASCPSCAGAVDASDRFCRHCGVRLQGARPARAGRRRRVPWALRAAAAAAAAATAARVSAQPPEDDVFSIERRLALERDRQAAIALEDAYDLESTPKEIHVSCPQVPFVEVTDLPDYAVTEHNQCLVFRVTAPDLEAKLTVRCDGEFETDGAFY